MSTPTQVAVDLRELGLLTAAAVHATVVRHGALLQTAVKAHAREPRTTPRPGPGGPRLLTGGYNRGIQRRTIRRVFESVTHVGTNDERGMRLEHGFTGEDSKGRSYHQKAYPHFGPALDEITEPFLADVAATAAAFTKHGKL